MRRVQPSPGAEPFLLAMWTTLPDEAEKIAETYGYRWNVEVDLRSLKSTLPLDELTGTTPEMVAKEIDLAMLSNNLVRAVMYQAAQKAGVKPRAFSFTYVPNVLHAFLRAIAAAYSDEQHLLELPFRSGALYHYSSVPPEIYGNLLRAPSQGAYFKRGIRDRFAYVKICPAAATQPLAALDPAGVECRVRSCQNR